MTLDLPELRTLAWRTFDCDSCGEQAGRRCVTASGARTTPHKARLDQARGWDARQGEVDALLADFNLMSAERDLFSDKAVELQQAVDQRDAIISGHAEALRAITVERDDLRANVRALTTENAGLKDQAATLERDLAATRSERNTLRDQVADLLDRIAELEQEPEPEPTKALTFGVGVDQLGTIEQVAGAPVAYHRTYFTLPASGVHAKAVAQAKADLAAGRTPVMSFKLPGTWSQAATGSFDTVIKATVDALAALGKPVIVAIHHEPEDDGTLADFKAMTAHLADVVKRPTVQFWVCFMGYHQLYGGSEWKLDKIHVPGVDGYGFDPYLSFGASSTKWTDQTASYYAKFGAWAKKHGVQWGIWETGINEQAITSGRPEARTWFADQVAGAKAHGATCWIYFNSETTKDGVHDWRITTTGANKQAQFAAVVKQYAPGVQ